MKPKFKKSKKNTMHIVYALFTFYDNDKSPHCVILDIPNEQFVNTFYYMHRKYINGERLVYKKYDGYAIDYAVFDLHCMHYVFMQIQVYNDKKKNDSLKSVNLQPLAYNIIWGDGDD